jgi:hypothetical protein
VQEFASGVMRRRLLVKLPFKGTKELVELFRFDHGPGNNLQISCMKPSDEVCVLFILNYLLKFEQVSRYC